MSHYSMCDLAIHGKKIRQSCPGKGTAEDRTKGECRLVSKFESLMALEVPLDVIQHVADDAGGFPGGKVQRACGDGRCGPWPGHLGRGAGRSFRV